MFVHVYSNSFQTILLWVLKFEIQMITVHINVQMWPLLSFYFTKITLHQSDFIIFIILYHLFFLEHIDETLIDYSGKAILFNDFSAS